MKTPSPNAAKPSERAARATEPATRRPQPGVDHPVVTLEDGEPCLEASSDGRWDWDTEALSTEPRCQLCGSDERVIREPDGRLLCEACLLRGPALASDARRPG